MSECASSSQNAVIPKRIVSHQYTTSPGENEINFSYHGGNNKNNRDDISVRSTEIGLARENFIGNNYGNGSTGNQGKLESVYQDYLSRAQY